MELLHCGIKVVYPDTMAGEEARKHCDFEIKMWNREYTNKELGRVVISICKDDPESVDVQAYEKSPIRRVRRITGYLTDMDNFNDAKLAELADRGPTSL